MLQIPNCQATRLSGESKYPFESTAHHPARGLRLCPGEEIKRRTDGKQDSRNPTAMLHYPAFLFWASNPTNTIGAPDSEICLVMASSSAGLKARNGGDIVKAIFS